MKHTDVVTPLKVLKRRQARLLKNPPLTQHVALKIVKDIADDVFRFRVQTERILKPYIIDIYIKNLCVGIEIDGGIHNTRETYDNNRDQFLWESYNVKIYRFDSKKVNRQEFRQAIWEVCLDGVGAYLGKIKTRAKDKNIILPPCFDPIEDVLKFRGRLLVGNNLEGAS